MANDIAGNPWILDTAGTVIAAGTKVTIIKMMFYANTAGDDLAVSDGNGHPFWRIRAASSADNYEDYAGLPFELVRPIQLDGFVIDTMDNAAAGGAGTPSSLWVWTA